MKRNILNEVNRMREIMGLNLILEQSESLFSAKDVMPGGSNNIVVRQYYSKLTEESESYWDSSATSSDGYNQSW